MTPVAIFGSLLWTVAGGVLSGVVVAGVLLFIAGRTEDHLVEITLTTIAAYGSFLMAEHFHMSGVLASLAAGLLVGNAGLKRAISEGGRSHVLAFWEKSGDCSGRKAFRSRTPSGICMFVPPRRIEIIGTGCKRCTIGAAGVASAALARGGTDDASPSSDGVTAI